MSSLPAAAARELRATLALAQLIQVLVHTGMHPFGRTGGLVELGTAGAELSGGEHPQAGVRVAGVAVLDPGGHAATIHTIERAGHDPGLHGGSDGWLPVL